MFFDADVINPRDGGLVKVIVNSEAIQEITPSEMIGCCRIVVLNTGGQIFYNVKMSMSDIRKILIPNALQLMS